MFLIPISNFSYSRPKQESDNVYVSILDDNTSRCLATWGYTPGLNRVNLRRHIYPFTNNCLASSLVASSLLHVLGLVNEHQRPDRDDYVEIDFDNILPQYRSDFEKCNTCKTYNVPYDPKSMLHYR